MFPAFRRSNVERGTLAMCAVLLFILLRSSRGHFCSSTETRTALNWRAVHTRGRNDINQTPPAPPPLPLPWPCSFCGSAVRFVAEMVPGREMSDYRRFEQAFLRGPFDAARKGDAETLGLLRSHG